MMKLLSLFRRQRPYTPPITLLTDPRECLIIFKRIGSKRSAEVARKLNATRSL